MAIRVLLSPLCFYIFSSANALSTYFPLPLISSVSLRQQAFNNEGVFGL